MSETRPILFLGGDARSRAMVERLHELGANVSCYGLGAFDAACGIEVVDSVEQGLRSCRAVILPMPAFDEKMGLPHPYQREIALPNAPKLFAAIGGSVPVFGGRVSPAVYACAGDFGVAIEDYSLSEEVQVRNAVPTAEGAIALAMQHMDITLHGSRVAVLGYGRIGTALGRRLVSLGAHVTVGARKAKDLARAEGDACTTLYLNDGAQLQTLCQGYDAIFNTVPHRLLSDELMARMPVQTVLIELASAPGGWDANARTACRLVNGQGLPGKCAPRTAGCLLADALWKQLREVT